MTSQTSLQQLNSKFAKPGILFEAGKGGLTRLTVNNALQQAELYLHGSHVTHWQPKGLNPVLFVSGSSLYQSDKPIRGGVPICWPWFGPKDNDAAAPMHGFARLTSWDVVSVEQDAQGVVTVVTSLPIEAKWQQLAGFNAQVLHRVVFGKTLQMTLTVRNTSASAIQFAEALHTYFALGDVRKATITGLENVLYVSKIEGGMRKTQDTNPMKFTGEIDRVYLGTQSTVVLKDASWNRTIRISKTGSNGTVVWNPWIDKSKALPDFGDNEWPNMICVESVNALDNIVQLAAGAEHEMTQKIEVVAGV